MWIRQVGLRGPPGPRANSGGGPSGPQQSPKLPFTWLSEILHLAKCKKGASSGYLLLPNWIRLQPWKQTHRAILDYRAIGVFVCLLFALFISCCKYTVKFSNHFKRITGLYSEKKSFLALQSSGLPPRGSFLLPAIRDRWHIQVCLFFYNNVRVLYRLFCTTISLLVVYLRNLHNSFNQLQSIPLLVWIEWMTHDLYSHSTLLVDTSIVSKHKESCNK